MRRFLLNYLILFFGILTTLLIIYNSYIKRPIVDDSFMAEDKIRLAMKKLKVKPYLIETLPGIILYSSKKYNVDWKDIIVTIQVESSWKEYAIGDSLPQTILRARGFGQHLPSTGQWIAERIGLPWHGPETLDNPVFSIQATAFYIAEEYIIWGTQEKMTKGYFLGDGRLHSYYDGNSDAIAFYKDNNAEGHWQTYKYYYNIISDI